MSDIYAVTLRIEVLREFASSINASYSRYFIKHDIDRKDRAHPLVINNREVIAMKDNLLRCETLEELQPFEMRLQELRDVIKGLEEEEICAKKDLRSTPKVSFARR
jgi:ATP-dependent RNA circularization protein (DNA/RNA ligase family)